MTIMFGFLPKVIKRSGCLWSLQLLLWNTTFTETSLYWMLKETGSLFDTNWWWDWNNATLYCSLTASPLLHTPRSPLCMVVCWSLSWRHIMLLLKLLPQYLWSMYPLCLCSIYFHEKSMVLISLFSEGFQEAKGLREVIVQLDSVYN